MRKFYVCIQLLDDCFLEAFAKQFFTSPNFQKVKVKVSYLTLVTKQAKTAFLHGPTVWKSPIVGIELATFRSESAELTTVPRDPFNYAAHTLFVRHFWPVLLIRCSEVSVFSLKTTIQFLPSSSRFFLKAHHGHSLWLSGSSTFNTAYDSDCFLYSKNLDVFVYPLTDNFKFERYCSAVSGFSEEKWSMSSPCQPFDHLRRSIFPPCNADCDHDIFLLTQVAQEVCQKLYQEHCPVNRTSHGPSLSMFS